MDTRGSDTEFSKTVTVDGVDYTIHMMGPTKATKLGTKVLKIVGEPMMTLAAASGDGDKVLELLPQAMSFLVRNMHEDEVVAIIKELVGSCKLERTKDINFEAYFQGKLGTMVRLTKAAGEVQLGDFFAGLGESAGAAMGV